MEEFLCSPESLDSVVEFSNYSLANNSDSGSGFFDFDDFDVHQDSLFLSTTTTPEPASHDSSTSSDVAVTPTSVNVKQDEFTCNFDLNSAVRSSGKTKGSTCAKQKGPLTVYIAQEENHKRRYPVGDSNSKNAVAARDNRLKKKHYVAELEKTVKKLQVDNSEMTKEVVESRRRLNDLENEVNYLRSVIANQSTLSAILTSVSRTPGISLSTSFREESEVGKTKTPITENTLKQADKKTVSKPKPYHRNLRSYNKQGPKKALIDKKGVQNMTAKEIVLCCKETRTMKKLDILNHKDSETESDMEDVDVDDSNTTTSTRGDQGGVCLHVTGNKVSLEFCANCNMKSNSDVSLDHSYVRK